MKHLDRAEFLAVVYRTIDQAANETGAQHPEDIMGSVLSTVETLYNFISNLPGGVSLGRLQ